MVNIKYPAITILVLISSIITGCGEDKLRTSNYYQENPKDMKEILKKCNAEYEKGYKPEGNFGENCDTANRVNNQMQINSIISSIR